MKYLKRSGAAAWVSSPPFDLRYYLVKPDQLSKTMPETAINLYDAKTHLSKLVDRAAAGEEIVIAKAGRRLAKLGPLESARPVREPGGWQGKAWIADDFDAPLPDELLDAFEQG